MRIKVFGSLLAAALILAQTMNAQTPERTFSVAAPLMGAPAAPQQAAPQQPHDLTGDWSGALDVQGRKLRLVLHLKKNADGKFTGAIDSPDQGANGLPLTNVEQTGDSVKLELSDIAAGYEGKLDSAGNSIT